MNKKLLAVSILLSLSMLSFAQGFQPEFKLRGIAKLKYNEIDVYKFQKGLSITAYPHNKLGTYQIQTHKEIDYDKQLVKLTAKLNNLELYPPIYISLESFNRNKFYGYFKSELLKKCRELMGNKEREQGEGLIPEIVIKLPKMALPKSVRRFMGDKAGRLNLNGSQRLTFAGRRTKRDEPGDERDDNIRFTPEMRQDLNLRLRGTIGEKIHVNVNHQSTSDEDVMPTPSEININYEGDEDEIVKAVDGGNISLSLAGSKFISYSASSEGLFGIKTQFEAGNLKVTTIMGKDEAQKSTQNWKGDSQPDSTVFRSNAFVNRTHYFIEQPSALYSLYSDTDGVEGVDYPMGWKDNAIKLEDGKWLLSPNGAGMLPDMTKEFTLYLDDGSASNNTMTKDGVNYLNPDEIYHFDILSEGTDYIVNDEAGIITMMGAVNKIYSIGITYTRKDGTVIGNDAISPVETKMLRINTQEVSDEDYWDLQVRNFYDLGMQNIKSDGFEMSVYTMPAGVTTPVYNAPEEVTTDDIKTLNEYLRLDSNNDLKINGEDAAINLVAGYIYFPFIKPFYSLNDSIIYLEENVPTNDINNYIFVKGKIGRDQISLGRMNILPGSIVIKIGPDKRKLIENIDFIADYDFGLITFLTSDAKDPEIEISIDFQFKPLFAMDNKTILGLRADMEFNENIKLGGTFIYQSEKVREDRPKIGNENRSIILADIDGEIDYELPFVTKFIDWLPLIKTDARSSVTLSSEVAMSLPRIYGSDKQHDKKEAYLDDMESTMEMYPLGITRATWSFASRPAEEPSGNLIDYGKAHINYYNPNDVYARDVYDPNSLTEKEEKEKVSVLACKIKPPDIGMPGTNMKYWAGVMKYIGNNIDFSKKKYIEILAKVDTLNYNQESRPVIMHIDLGKMSEDFYRPGENDEPDKEDGIVEADGILDGGEDVGLDRIETGDPGDDPDDNFDNEEVIINGAEEYPYINGTEGNNKLDSEDLNDTGILEEDNIYFEYSVSLNDGEEFMEGEFNGWRLFRIPLHNPDNYRIITDNANEVPNIKKITFSRIWFEVEDSTRVRIVNLDIVGNKWEEGFIKNEDGTVATSNTEIMQVGIADNQSGQHYTPAPHTVIKENGEVTLEQSLTIDYNDLETRKHGLVTQEFLDPYNLLSYNKIRYWVYAEKPITGYSPEEQDSLIIRLGADSVNYYEIKQPLYLQEYNTIMDEDGWKELEIEFSEFTQLKNLDINNDISYYIGDIKLSKVGNPSLSDVREMSLGLEASNQFTGRIYFDDIRVADPYEDFGIATRANFSTSFADFATFNIGLDYRSENFQSSARRTTSVSYVQQTSLDITNRINLNKFMPAEWGFSIPLNLARTQSVGIPRFKSGSDILREDLLAEDKDRETNRNLSYRADLTINQTKTPKSKILAYTLKNTTISGNIQKTFATNANRADTTTTYTLKHVYNFTIPKEKIDIGLLPNYKFHFFPHSISNTLTLRDTDPFAWRWDTYTDSIPQWVPNTNSFKTRTFETSSGVDYDILSDISTSYDLTTRRDLMLKNYWKGYNIGEEKKRTQNITIGFDPKYIDAIISFNGDVSVTYDDDHVKSGTQDTLYYKGGVNRKIGGQVTLKNQDMLRDLASWLDKKFSKSVVLEGEGKQQGEEIKEEEKDNFEQPEMRTPFGGEVPKDKLEEPEKRGEGDSKEGEELKGGSPEEPGKGDEEGQKEPEKKPEQPTIPERKSNLLASIVSYISGLSNISVSYSNIYRTTYDDRFDRPDFLYQLGLPHILDEEGDDKEIILKTITDNYSTSASFPIIRNLSSNFGYSRDITTTLSNISKLKITTTFPNVSVTLTEFEKLIHAEKILTSSRLTSSYVYSEMLDGDIGFTQADTEQNRINLTPLISWHGNWIHNITSSFSLNYSDLKNISHRVNYDDIRHTTSQSMNGNLSWSFSNPKGIRILFFKRTNMKNEITTDVNFNMTMDKTTSKGQEKEITEIEKTSYSITPGASYKFSKSITAGLTSEYEWTEDKKRKTSSSMFRLSIWIEIIF
ncbi:MAG: cell surface protein SprA [Candidatus Cloacimonetes bacterium]|jgi:hypothetical protein|nr:cell surface protein SprA [Candidatus Cloacimonadota bacterium]